ncbi:Cd(II)/Pb(II)-responsive transcriptional regulator [Duganella sp. CT11-25]|uniref:Cd(II)/Pb(II)-responsive transcriptional regulator n=1 Tax=unclassified Duganella TaxID=2636909 RepID=UPI0039AF2CCA
MKIGDLSRETGTSVETIRYYERMNLLQTPPRSDANYRLYGAQHLERILFIRACRSLDISLDEIRTLLALRASPEAGCDGVNRLLDTHIQAVEARIRELHLLQQQLRDLRQSCQSVDSIRNCKILQALETPTPARN